MASSYYHALGILLHLWALTMVGVACSYFMGSKKERRQEVAPLPLLLTAFLELALGFVLLKA